MRKYFLFSLLILFFSCKNNTEKTLQNNTPAVENTLFSKMPAAYTGIDFINQVDYTEEFNPYTYRSFYNGGGVGIGDFNNDGLVDVFMCANQKSNKLYINKGNFQFEDITDRAGLNSESVWSTGVSIADVNGDGWLDIYICKSGSPQGKKRHNELFINKHDLTFEEKATEYGIADLGLSTHAAFFDYDKDGDLDMYLLNNSTRTVGGFDLRKDQRLERDSLGANKLYQNNLTSGGKFTDVSAKAGIYGSNIGFGLGVTIGDLNRDGWLDIYVSNDFFERDYLYLNNKNGTFTECLEDKMHEISMGSMGADMADMNNDGAPEIFVTEMLPHDDARYKTKAQFENWNKYQMNVNAGYFQQFSRNVFQRNNNDGTFSEIGRLAGVEATDWSWGALMTDLDNDGHKDIFVANGIYKDLLDQDYINFYNDPEVMRRLIRRETAVLKHLIDSIPSNPLPNYAFWNNGDWTFDNNAKDWGLDEPSFSNGSAYADLDNDGDLDLVINNLNMPCFIYRNNATDLLKDNHFLKINLVGESPNTFALGSQVTIKHAGKSYYQELCPMRGFESCVDSRLNFGLGNLAEVDSVLVQWHNDKVTVLTNIKTNQILNINIKEAKKSESPAKILNHKKDLFSVINAKQIIDFQHIENIDFSDFDRDRLIFNMISNESPHIAKGDINGDGRDDIFIGNAKGSPAGLFIQQANGAFKRSNQALFEADKSSEDADCLFFDADGDHDLDLYVASGGNEFSNSSIALLDRLYFNDGHGNFKKSSQPLPTTLFESTSCVKAADFDKDGDLDLFVGIRLQTFLYGAPCNGYLLQNDGKGNFKNINAEFAPELNNLGMITDAVWADIDGNKTPDLVVVGEFMPITIFKNEQGKFKSKLQIPNSSGFWNRIKAADLDGDSDMDFVLGNHGLNSRFRADAKHPIEMYISDFDQNGAAEQILCQYEGEKSYPMVLRNDLVSQIPSLKKKYLKFNKYKNQTINDIFSEAQLKNAIKVEAQTLATSILINNGSNNFALQALATDAQLAPTYAIVIQDFDKDGKNDILLGGNFSRAKPETGIYEASYGTFLKGNGRGGFVAVPNASSGLLIQGEVRDMVSLKRGKENCILVGINNNYPKLIRLLKPIND